MEGLYNHVLDAKGRISIPSRIRSELGDTFYITLSTEQCLSAYSQESWNGLRERIRALPQVKQKKMRPLFAHAARCEIDAQGRVLLPQHLRSFAKLERDVTIVGNGDCAEFWDTDTWNAIDVEETTPENIADVFMELDF
ncbi:MAG: division/cell wall cluster transcriptional repressor MraZ [Oscillospiraceae bacterium]|nr:division/cell wall cluster transcriptional repressor MraZ [Oscillospiraceae bacterium]